MLVGKRFDAALATTNYDTLLHPSGATVTWQERDRLLAVLRGDHRPNRYPSTVAHLHGYWAEPDTVIFGDSDYERRAADSYAATLDDVIAFGTRSCSSDAAMGSTIRTGDGCFAASRGSRRGTHTSGYAVRVTLATRPRSCGTSSTATTTTTTTTTSFRS